MRQECYIYIEQIHLINVTVQQATFVQKTAYAYDWSGSYQTNGF